MRKRTRARTKAVSTFRAVGESVGAGTNALLDTALTGIFTRLRSETDLLLNNVEDHMMEFRSRMMKRFLASLLIGIGALLLFTAILLYIVESGHLSVATAFLITSILIFIVAFIIQMQARR